MSDEIEQTDATTAPGFVPPEAPREMTNDPKAMRALAHPVRVALMEELAIVPELTATQAAELVGESPANCSFHLRQLAKYGFVEEAGTGQGRNRPWRLATVSMHFDAVSAEPEAAVAMHQLTSIFLDRALERVRTWWKTESRFPKRWRKAARSNQSIWWVTAEELDEIGEELTALMYRFHERVQDPDQRPEGALPVEFLVFAYPLVAPAAESPATEGGTPGTAKPEADR